jgi:pyridoxamine 5'-phosphate oxidase
MADRTGHFAGDDPFALARAWLAEAEKSEINDPNAIALASVDADGLPNVRMVLLKDIEADGQGEGAFVFYTNYDSAKAREIAASGKAAFVMHWKSLRRQIRVRGPVEREDGPPADAYFASRSLKSRLGAWASRAIPSAGQPRGAHGRGGEGDRAAGTAPKRGRHSGAGSASARWRSSSGPMAPSGCMTGSAGPATGRAGGAAKRLVGDAPEPLIVPRDSAFGRTPAGIPFAKREFSNASNSRKFLGCPGGRKPAICLTGTTRGWDATIQGTYLT